MIPSEQGSPPQLEERAEIVLRGANLSTRSSRKVRLSVALDFEEPVNTLDDSVHSADMDQFPVHGSTDMFKMVSTSEDYTSLKHLCDGTNSNIYKAVVKETGEPIILKVLKKEGVENEKMVREFQREINALRRVDHRHIIKIHGSGSMKFSTSEVERPCILVERLSGGTLSYHIASERPFHNRPFTYGRMLRIAKELIDALDFIHIKFNSEFVMIHRDLKPDNVAFMLDGTLKLLDFGLCICIPRNASDNGKYVLTGCTGSLRFMAPEVARSKPYNEKVDIYSYGLILYQTITGVTPFAGLKKDAFTKRVVMDGERPPIDNDEYARRIIVDEELREIIVRCWDADSEKRPSASEVLAVLTRLEQEERLRLEAGGICTFISRLFGPTDPV